MENNLEIGSVHVVGVIQHISKHIINPDIAVFEMTSDGKHIIIR